MLREEGAWPAGVDREVGAGAESPESGGTRGVRISHPSISQIGSRTVAGRNGMLGDALLRSGS